MREKIQKDEVILFEGSVRCSNLKGTLILTLTPGRILFAKEKGLFKKVKEIEDVINLETIKVYNDEIQVIQRGGDISIQTLEKNVEISFPGIMDASKFYEKLKEALTKI